MIHNTITSTPKYNTIHILFCKSGLSFICAYFLPNFKKNITYIRRVFTLRIMGVKLYISKSCYHLETKFYRT